VVVAEITTVLDALRHVLAERQIKTAAVRFGFDASKSNLPGWAAVIAVPVPLEPLLPQATELNAMFDAL